MIEKNITMWKMNINAVLDSEITVWVLGIADLILLVVVVVSIVSSKKDTYNFEKMKSNFKNK
ncbi:hypothetical protein [Flavobacterium sp. CF136]|jgi:hypothetical protein|uniref:hypothetical protein n=1 Tax=Flavobacterium sp. (strain CF136) TaxID=1144313 RepID=UPI0002E33203|nr:hypothetical protein [Flavobacterium sp. CF136]